ncbi:MAG: tRNA nucleotidyltransferase/poly(A) polymerase family protein [Thermoanaerobaculia bacterium]
MTTAPALPLGLLGELGHRARDAGARIYLVGGAVRDAVLGRAPTDLDVALEGPASAADALVRELGGRGWTCEARHARFGTATLRPPSGTRVDLATTREETYPVSGALPVVRCGASIERDLARRDFSIHAMALSLGPEGPEGAPIDPFDGAGDLALRRIRLLHDRSLADDPTRVFRAARYAARLGFSLDTGFDAAMQHAVSAGAFLTISGDRLRRAFEEVLSEENRHVALDLLLRLGVPATIVPGWEGAHFPPPGETTTTASVPEQWQRLLAPVPDALRAQIARRLAFSRALRAAAGCGR